MAEIKITEAELHTIINEAINDYMDKGTFTPIGNAAYKGGNASYQKSDNRLNAALIKSLNSIANMLWSESDYLKHTCNVMNPMFITKIEPGNDRKAAQIAQQVYAKCRELYDFINKSKEELGIK